MIINCPQKKIMTSKSAFEISSDQKVHLVSAANKIGKFCWPGITNYYTHFPLKSNPYNRQNSSLNVASSVRRPTELELLKPQLPPPFLFISSSLLAEPRHNLYLIVTPRHQPQTTEGLIQATRRRYHGWLKGAFLILGLFS